jgi:hypothetical protein
MKSPPIFSMLLLAMVFAACGLESRAAVPGTSLVITVTCESADKGAGEDVIENVFVQAFFTPQPGQSLRCQLLNPAIFIDHKGSRTMHLQFDEVTVPARLAIRTNVLWCRNSCSMSGPSLSPVIDDEQQSRGCSVDGSVFSLSYEKNKLIQDVDIVMSTSVTSIKADKKPV